MSLAGQVERRRKSRDGQKPSRPDMVWVEGGTFLMGSDNHYPEEGPAHRVGVGGFWIDRFPVTNHDFARFVEAHGTRARSAERPPRGRGLSGHQAGNAAPGIGGFPEAGLAASGC